MASPIRVKNNKGKNERAEAEELFYSRHEKMKLDFKNLSLDEQFVSFISSVTMNNEDIRLRHRILEDLISVLRKEYKNICLFSFGSFVTGLGDKDSDLDVVADCAGNAMSTGRSLETDVKKKIFESVFRILCRRGQNSFFRKIIPISAARVPIIKLIHTPTKLQCDISFENLLSVRNSRLILLLVELDPRVRPLMCLIRYWGRFHKLIDSMKIKNYGLILLILVFLKQKNIIPSVYQLQNWDPKPPEVRIDWWNASFYSNKEEIIKFMDREGRPPVELNQFNEPTGVSILTLAKEFFEFYAKFSADKYVICSLTGSLIPRDLFIEGCENRLPAEMKDYKEFCNNFDPQTMGRRLNTESKMSLVIQDPFALSFNVSAVTRKHVLDRFQLACESTAAHLKSCLNSSDLPNTYLSLMDTFNALDSDEALRTNIQNNDNSKKIRLEDVQQELAASTSNIFKQKVLDYVDAQDEIHQTICVSAQAEKKVVLDVDYNDFIEGGSAIAPPFQHFLSGNGERLYEFIASGVETEDYCFVQNLEILDKLYELETSMSTWYGKYFSKNEIWIPKNWHKVAIGGYYAAWLESRNRWVRACALRRIYSEKETEKIIGKYKVAVHMLDYGIITTVERFHLVPMRREFLTLPVVASMVPLQCKFGVALTRELCRAGFKAFVLDQHSVDSMPYLRLDVLIVDSGQETLQRVRLRIIRNLLAVERNDRSPFPCRGRGRRIISHTYPNPFLQP